MSNLNVEFEMYLNVEEWLKIVNTARILKKSNWLRQYTSNGTNTFLYLLIDR
jgi:hypothetical protein